MKKQTLRTIMLSMCVATTGQAQLSLTTLDNPFVIDFEDTRAGVASGRFTGAGFKPLPGAGQLDSDAFAVTALSSGILNFGGTATSTDAARGISNAGASANTGGIYAIHNLALPGNTGIGFRPTGTSLLNGGLTLRLANDTGTALTQLDVGYNVFTLNDNTRSTRIGLAYSLDNVVFTSLPSLDVTTSTTADASPAWQLAQRTVSIDGLSLDPGAPFYVRWNLSDNGGAGSRDLIALDNLSISAVPEPAGWSLLGLGLGGLAWYRRRGHPRPEATA